MSFLKLILKNPFRRKNSTILAIVGICIGIATIVALGTITDGLVANFEDTIHAGGADFTVTGKEAGSSAYGTNTIDYNWTNRIADVEGVSEVFPIYVTLVSSSDNPYFPLVGIDPEGISSAEISLIEGHVYKNNSNEVIIGKIFAENNNISLGDSVSLNEKKFKVVGIYESGDANSDDGAYTSIKTVGNITNEPNTISNVYVKVDKGEDVQKVADRIDKKYGDNVTVVTSVMEMEQMSKMLDTLKAASWGISLLAIIIGGLGIINTMLMSVMERTRELGVLKAVGWSSKRILILIIGESLVITLISGIIGSIIGATCSWILGPTMGFNPVFNLSVFIQAFSVAIIVGILGGLYPAIKAVKLPPTEALRYE